MKNLIFTVWGDNEEKKAIKDVLEAAITDAAISAKTVNTIDSSSCIDTFEDLERIAVSMASVAKYSWFEIIGEEDGEQFRIAYEWSVLKALKKDGEYLISLPEGLITINDMTSNLEEYAETAGFENYYERVLKNWSEDKIREEHARIFESVMEG